MSLLSRLFGGGASAPKSADPVDYKGCRIIPEPVAEGGKFRLAARIEKDVDGETRTHKLIRADMLDSFEIASEIAVTKAKQVIDFEGDRIFTDTA